MTDPGPSSSRMPSPERVRGAPAHNRSYQEPFPSNLREVTLQVTMPTSLVQCSLAWHLLRLSLQILCKQPPCSSGKFYHYVLRLCYLTADLIVYRFNEIRLTDPSSQANGMLSARIDTRIKLHISFQPSSQVQFLRIPKTPSVHDDRPEPEQALRFSLELRGAAGGAIIGNVCSKCKERKGQATWDIVDFRAPTTIITIENGTATIEFFIKCYPQHHGLDPCGFW